MEIFLLFFLVVLGFAFLIKGADVLVEGSVSVAFRLKISQAVIGLTVVAFGTSAPELIVNAIASFQSKGDLVFGNIIGSNIFNTLLILGACGVIKTVKFDKRAVSREMPFSFFAIVILFFFVNESLYGQVHVLSRGEGVALLVLFCIFIAYIFSVMKSTIVEEISDAKDMSGLKSIIFIVLGLSGLFIGGKLVVDNAVEIAQIFGVSEKFIALTIVSAGTSLPELVTSIVAAVKGRSAIAAGNIIGSNIFNVFLILGISAVIKPVSFDVQLNTDLIILFAANMFLLFSMFTGIKYSLEKWKAGVLFGIFSFYIVFLFLRG